MSNMANFGFNLGENRACFGIKWCEVYCGEILKKKKKKIQLFLLLKNVMP